MRLIVFLVCVSSMVSFGQCAPVDLGRVAELYGVVRGTGSSIAGAKLSVEGADRKKPPVETTLSADGHFRFPKLSPGKYRVLLHRKGLPDNHYVVQIAPRAAHKAINVTLQIAGVC
jgi:hypothetical protein